MRPCFLLLLPFFLHCTSTIGSYERRQIRVRWLARSDLCIRHQSLISTKTTANQKSAHLGLLRTFPRPLSVSPTKQIEVSRNPFYKENPTIRFNGQYCRICLLCCRKSCYLYEVFIASLKLSDLSIKPCQHSHPHPQPQQSQSLHQVSEIPIRGEPATASGCSFRCRMSTDAATAVSCNSTVTAITILMTARAVLLLFLIFHRLVGIIRLGLFFRFCDTFRHVLLISWWFRNRCHRHLLLNWSYWRLYNWNCRLLLSRRKLCPLKVDGCFLLPRSKVNPEASEDCHPSSIMFHVTWTSSLDDCCLVEEDLYFLHPLIQQVPSLSFHLWILMASVLQP